MGPWSSGCRMQSVCCSANFRKTREAVGCKFSRGAESRHRSGCASAERAWASSLRRQARADGPASELDFNFVVVVLP
eukprot:1764784-Rhodomonas_salina.5